MELKQFIEKSISETSYAVYTIGKINAVYAKKLKEKTGLDITGYDVVIDSNAIKHVFKNHGDKNIEERRNQIAVTKNDILLIPEILFNPDIVDKSEKKNSKGLEVIKYIKQYKNRYYVIEEIRSGQKTIALNTMYIKKNLL